jgi:hypothetical protein
MQESIAVLSVQALMAEVQRTAMMGIARLSTLASGGGTDRNVMGLKTLKQGLFPDPFTTAKSRLSVHGKLLRGMHSKEHAHAP